jgi:ketosteroid isomerase-like protein
LRLHLQRAQRVSAGHGQLIEASGGKLQVESTYTAVNGLDGDQVITTSHATGTVKNEPLDEYNAALWTVADGLVVQLVDFYGDPETVARQWD